MSEIDENIRRLWSERSTRSSGSQHVPRSPAQPLNNLSHLKSLFSFDLGFPELPPAENQEIHFCTKKSSCQITIGIKLFKWDLPTSQSKLLNSPTICMAIAAATMSHILPASTRGRRRRLESIMAAAAEIIWRIKSHSSPSPAGAAAVRPPPKHESETAHLVSLL